MKEYLDILELLADLKNVLDESEISEAKAIKSGTDFEKLLVRKLELLLPINAIDYKEKSHRFPDILVTLSDGTQHGIEAKSTQRAGKGWTINGNSIVGTTSVKGLSSVYLFFGKFGKTVPEYRFRRYEDCIADIVVTHSPRYKIDMDLEEGETFFDKSGLDYKSLSNSNDPVPKIADYYRGQGLKAWWLVDSTPAAIGLWSSLSRESQDRLRAQVLVHFPSMFSKNPKKFEKVAEWLISEKGVISSSLRDKFTAGGKVDIFIGPRVFQQLPKIFKTVLSLKQLILEELDQSDPLQLARDWDMALVGNNLSAKLEAWISQVSNAFDATDAPKDFVLREFMEAVFE